MMGLGLLNGKPELFPKNSFGFLLAYSYLCNIERKS